MKKFILSTMLLYAMPGLFAQVPDTDIFLVEILKAKSGITFGKPVNITDRPGYDNQPVFNHDNNKILYVGMEDTIQTEIYEYDIINKKTIKMGETPESEYSPAYIKGENGISIVRVDADKAQRLYKYENNPASAELLIEGVDSVGYYRWLNDTTIALVVLNNGLELHVYEIYSHQFIIAAKNVGRCLLRDPESGNLIYTLQSGDETTLMTLNPETFESELYCKGMKDSKDYIFTPGGELWTGSEGKLYSLDPGSKKEWVEKADFTKSVGSFYRLAMSDNGKYLALVSYKEKRP